MAPALLMTSSSLSSISISSSQYNHQVYGKLSRFLCRRRYCGIVFGRNPLLTILSALSSQLSSSPSSRPPSPPLSKMKTKMPISSMSSNQCFLSRTNRKLVSGTARTISTYRDHCRPRVVTVYNELHRGCLSYEQTWAWQQILLQQRLAEAATAQKHHQPQQQDEIHDKDSTMRTRYNDCVLIVEHKPVYTLGRGADEKHLAFLNDESPHVNKEESSSCNTTTTLTTSAVFIPSTVNMLREKLSRKSRGPGTARLCLERHVEDGLKRKVHQQMAEALTTTMPTPDDASTRAPSPMYSSIVDDLLTEMAVEPVVAPNGVPVYRVERGGEVTCHVPSQLVVYPIFDLRRPPFKDDLRWYWTTLEQVVIDTIKEYGIEGTRDEINTGVWVGQDKVAAIGIAASRWITHHGFALNVDPELSYFDKKFILPCGIEGRGVTSMAAILRGQDEPIPSLHEVADVVLEQMKKHFDIHIELG